eukprot:1766922-Pyramimonas_sp.AAC.1
MPRHRQCCARALPAEGPSQRRGAPMLCYLPVEAFNRNHHVEGFQSTFLFVEGCNINATPMNESATLALCQRKANATPRNTSAVQFYAMSAPIGQCNASTWPAQGFQGECAPPQIQRNAFAAPALYQRKAKAAPRG